MVEETEAQGHEVTPPDQAACEEQRATFNPGYLALEYMLLTIIQ